VTHDTRNTIIFGGMICFWQFCMFYPAFKIKRREIRDRRAKTKAIREKQVRNPNAS
jgi:hypothetical protein